MIVASLCAALLVGAAPVGVSGGLELPEQVIARRPRAEFGRQARNDAAIGAPEVV